MRLKKIQLNELEQFLESEAVRALQPKPVSSFRAVSYLNNPHAKPNDIVLYFFCIENNLIAYRTVFAAKLTGEDERFAWLSGNWVHPDYRRQGHSERLLNEILHDWGHRLMFTNYAPASLQLYLKSKQFQAIYSGTGRRFYLFAKTDKLLGHRFEKGAFVFPVLDFLVQLTANIVLFFFKPKKREGFKMEEAGFPDEACLLLAEREKSNYLFERGKRELEWIFSNPWVSTTDGSFADNYAFSSYSTQFQYKTAKFYFENEFAGFLIYLIRDGHLKIVHFQVQENMVNVAAGYLIEKASKSKIEVLSVLNPQLAIAVKNKRNPFLFSKRIEHGIYASFPVSTDRKKIQDGDGDYIFS
jgi:GNAT superfamily N-acetyltransferase